MSGIRLYPSETTKNYVNVFGLLKYVIPIDINEFQKSA